VKKRSCLSPAAVSLAALLAAGAVGSSQAILPGAFQIPAIEKMADASSGVSTFVIERNTGPEIRLAQHMSHSSHVSHGSHSSHSSHVSSSY